MNLHNLQTWEFLMKQIVWKQIGTIENKRILDFGSGHGITADHFAAGNEVFAIEPSQESIDMRWQENQYAQICGSIEKLQELDDELFDIIICHNVLEYAKKREEIVKEFNRVLKKEGYISLVKHNRPGRVMQMVVLLNDFEKANSLLHENDASKNLGYNTSSVFCLQTL